MLPTTDDRQTDRQTDGRQHIANVNVSSRSLKNVKIDLEISVTKTQSTLEERRNRQDIIEVLKM